MNDYIEYICKMDVPDSDGTTVRKTIEFANKKGKQQELMIRRAHGIPDEEPQVNTDLRYLLSIFFDLLDGKASAQEPVSLSDIKNWQELYQKTLTIPEIDIIRSMDRTVVSFVKNKSMNEIKKAGKK